MRVFPRQAGVVLAFADRPDGLEVPVDEGLLRFHLAVGQGLSESVVGDRRILVQQVVAVDDVSMDVMADQCAKRRHGRDRCGGVAVGNVSGMGDTAAASLSSIGADEAADAVVAVDGTGSVAVGHVSKVLAQEPTDEVEAVYGGGAVAAGHGAVVLPGKRPAGAGACDADALQAKFQHATLLRDDAEQPQGPGVLAGLDRQVCDRMSPAVEASGEGLVVRREQRVRVGPADQVNVTCQDEVRAVKVRALDQGLQPGRTTLCSRISWEEFTT